MIKVQNVASFHDSLIELLEYVQTVENIEIIVPDKLSLYMEKFLFERLNIESSFNIKVSTLNRFAKKNVEIKKENQISKTGSVLLVHKILNENFDKLLTLKSKTYSFTYAEEIFNTIAQLKASKILPEEMLKFESSEISLKDKIQDLALIYEEYEKNKAGLLDASDCFLISVFSVSDGRKNQNLVFVGFDDFTAVEYSIIEQLSLENNVKIFNYNSKKSNKHIYNSEVVEQLRNISLIRQIPFEIETSERHENNE